MNGPLRRGYLPVRLAGCHLLRSSSLQSRIPTQARHGVPRSAINNVRPAFAAQARDWENLQCRAVRSFVVRYFTLGVEHRCNISFIDSARRHTVTSRRHSRDSSAAIAASMLIALPLLACAAAALKTSPFPQNYGDFTLSKIPRQRQKAQPSELKITENVVQLTRARSGTSLSSTFVHAMRRFGRSRVSRVAVGDGMSGSSMVVAC